MAFLEQSHACPPWTVGKLIHTLVVFMSLGVHGVLRASVWVSKHRHS